MSGGDSRINRTNSRPANNDRGAVVDNDAPPKSAPTLQERIKKYKEAAQGLNKPSSKHRSEVDTLPNKITSGHVKEIIGDWPNKFKPANGKPADLSKEIMVKVDGVKPGGNDVKVAPANVLEGEVEGGHNNNGELDVKAGELTFANFSEGPDDSVIAPKYLDSDDLFASLQAAAPNKRHSWTGKKDWGRHADWTDENNFIGSKNFFRKLKVDDNVLRGSAPNYYNSKKTGEDGEDNKCVYSQKVVEELIDDKVSLVVSFNEHEKTEGVENLQEEGINFKHFCTADYSSPKLEELEDMCRLIEENKGKTYIHCGYGQGRTGTAVTAYEIFNDKIKGDEELDEKMKENGVEEGSQRLILRKFYNKRYPSDNIQVHEGKQSKNGDNHSVDSDDGKIDFMKIEL